MFELPGGLAEEVTEKIIHAAFIPFGDLMDIQIPLDYETGMFLLLDCQFERNKRFENKDQFVTYHFLVEKHRGFAFVEFELAEVR